MHLYGSRARGEHRPASDVDIFVHEWEVLFIPEELVAFAGHDDGPYGRAPIDMFLYPDEDGVSVCPYKPDRRGKIDVEDMVEITPEETIQLGYLAMARRGCTVLGRTINSVRVICSSLELENGTITGGQSTYIVMDGAAKPTYGSDPLAVIGLLCQRFNLSLSINAEENWFQIDVS